MVALTLPQVSDNDSTARFRPVQFRTRDQLLITGERSGPEHATQVVLLPGPGRTRRSWRETARTLATAGYCVTSLDLRGHGGSGWPKDGDYSLRAFADDLHAVLRQMSSRPAVVVGASLGGAAALMAVAESQEEEIAGLALIDILPPASDDGFSHFERFMTECERGFDDVQEAFDKAASFFRAGVLSSAADDVRTSLRRGTDGRLYWHWDPGSPPPQSWQMRTDTRLVLAAAAKVAVPTLLLTGVGGDEAEASGIAAFRNAAPRAQWINVSASHGGTPQPSMRRATAPLLRFIERHWPPNRHELETGSHSKQCTCPIGNEM